MDDPVAVRLLRLSILAVGLGVVTASPALGLDPDVSTIQPPAQTLGQREAAARAREAADRENATALQFADYLAACTALAAHPEVRNAAGEILALAIAACRDEARAALNHTLASDAMLVCVQQAMDCSVHFGTVHRAAQNLRWATIEAAAMRDAAKIDARGR